VGQPACRRTFIDSVTVSPPDSGERAEGAAGGAGKKSVRMIAATAPLFDRRAASGGRVVAEEDFDGKVRRFPAGLGRRRIRFNFAILARRMRSESLPRRQNLIVATPARVAQLPIVRVRSS